MTEEQLEQALIEAQARGAAEMATVPTEQLFVMLASVVTVLTGRLGRVPVAEDLRDLADTLEHRKPH